ncbi:MAG: YbdD/YjiX family protein [Bdellovibrionia bacterium]
MRTKVSWIYRCFQRAQQTFRLMVGVPDYETYVRHQKERHPTAPVLSYKEFFREAQKKRYEGSGQGKCC